MYIHVHILFLSISNFNFAAYKSTCLQQPLATALGWPLRTWKHALAGRHTVETLNSLDPWVQSLVENHQL